MIITTSNKSWNQKGSAGCLICITTLSFRRRMQKTVHCKKKNGVFSLVAKYSFLWFFPGVEHAQRFPWSQNALTLFPSLKQKSEHNILNKPQTGTTTSVKGEGEKVRIQQPSLYSQATQHLRKEETDIAKREKRRTGFKGATDFWGHWTNAVLNWLETERWLIRTDSWNCALKGEQAVTQKARGMHDKLQSRP